MVSADKANNAGGSKPSKALCMQQTSNVHEVVTARLTLSFTVRCALAYATSQSFPLHRHVALRHWIDAMSKTGGAGTPQGVGYTQVALAEQKVMGCKCKWVPKHDCAAKGTCLDTQRQQKLWHELNTFLRFFLAGSGSAAATGAG